MSLVLVTLAVTLLAGFARRSLSLAVGVHQAREDLQLRCGMDSVSRALLGRAEKILAEHVRSNSERPGDSRLLYPCIETVRLGGLDFRLVLDDENRKININRLYISGGSQRVFDCLHQFGQSMTATRLRPQDGNPREVAVRPFASWGQVYKLDELPGEEAPPPWLMANTQDLTCWGNGRVHFRKSSDRALAALARYAAGPVTASRLVSIRGREPSLSLDELLDRLSARQREKNRLKGWLTDESLCFSLWITVEGIEHQRHELAVKEVTAGGSSQIHRFTW